MAGNEWYNRRGAMMKIDDLEKEMPKVKIVSYFKVTYLTGGTQRRHHIQFWKTMDNGYMIYVDVGQMKTGIVQGLPFGRVLHASTKKEYESAKNKLYKVLG